MPRSAVLENAQAGGLPADAKDLVLPTGPTGEVEFRLYRPRGINGFLPVIMHLYGGGWVFGRKNTHDQLLRAMVRATGVALVFVSYPPSPDAQFPTSLEQCCAATNDPDGGSHADGEGERRPGDSLPGAVLPCDDAGMAAAPYQEEFADGPRLTKPAMASFWDAFAPNLHDRGQVRSSPPRSSLDGPQDLPPAPVTVDYMTLFATKAYAKKLLQADVELQRRG